MFLKFSKLNFFCKSVLKKRSIKKNEKMASIKKIRRM